MSVYSTHRRSLPDVGDLVTVLEWQEGASRGLRVPHTGCVQGLDHPSYAPIRVSNPEARKFARYAPGSWARRWMQPTPEELTAYQLSQLAGGGL